MLSGVTFLDGPAAGVRLNLARAPILLRVVVDRNGKFDALDQLEDKPRDGECVYVYRIMGLPSHVHVDYRDKQGRRRGEWLLAAKYALLPDQPASDQVRDNERWRAWCHAWAKDNGIEA